MAKSRIITEEKEKNRTSSPERIRKRRNAWLKKEIQKYGELKIRPEL